MQKVSFRLLFLILLLGFVTLACGGSGNATTAIPPTVAAVATLGEDAAAPTPTSPPATELPPAPEATATPVAAASSATPSPTPVNLNASNNYGEPAGVTSYRMSLRFDSTLTGADGSVTTGSILIEGQRDVAQDASTFTATSTGTADFGGGQTFNFTQIGDTTYFILPNGSCTSFSGSGPSSENNLFAVFLDDGGVLGNLNGAELGIPPTETVNGILTNHYTFNETHLDPTDPTTPDITSVTGDIYLAAEGDYVVRLVMQGIGSSNLLNGIAGDGDIYYELNYFDFDAPVAITIPGGCTDEVGYPVLPDATDQASIGGFISYRSSTSFADAVNFYKTEMAAAGWTLSQEVGGAPAVTLVFTQNGEQVQIIIAQDGEGVTVAIMDQLPPG